MDPNTAGINVLLKSSIDTSKAIADLQRLTSQAKAEAQKLNKSLENAFKMPNTFGKGGGIFGSMLQSIKELQKNVNTVSTTIRSSMSDLTVSVEKVNNSISKLSSSINKLTSKKNIIKIEQEITTTRKDRSGKTAARGDSSPSSTPGIIGTKRLSSRTGERILSFNEYKDNDAEIRQKKINQTQENKNYQTWLMSKQAENKRVAEERKRTYTSPIGASGASAMLPQKVQVDRYNKWLQSKQAENDLAALNRQTADDKAYARWLYANRQANEKIVEKDRARVNSLSSQKYAQNLLDRQKAERVAIAGKGLTGQFSPISEQYLTQMRWEKGQFNKGPAMDADLKKYIKYATQTQGMTPQQIMSKITPFVKEQIPAGSLVNQSITAVTGYKVDPRTSALMNYANLAAKAGGATRSVNELGKSLSNVNSLVRMQGEAVIRLGRYYMSFMMITTAIRTVGEAFRQTIALQDQLLETQKFLPKGSSVGALREAAYPMAKQFAVPIDTVLGSYIEFAKQGKQTNEIINFTKAALLGVNVASTDYATTVTYLTTATNVWKNQFSDLTTLIDKIAIVQSKSTATANTMIASMQRTSSVAKTMGVSLDQLLGYTAAISEKTQLSGEVIGTSLKTILERSRRGKTISMLEGMEPFKNNAFVDPMTQALAGAPRILETVASKWNLLTDVQQRNIATQMAGSRQMNSFIALMENFDKAIFLTSESLNSFGFAQNANEKQLQKFSATWQQTSTVMYEVSTGVLTPFISILTEVLRVINSVTGAMPGFTKAIVGGIAGFSLYSGLSIMLGSIGTSFIGMVGKIITAFSLLITGSATGVASLLGLQSAAMSTGTGLTFVELEAIAASGGMTSLAGSTTVAATAMKMFTASIPFVGAFMMIASIAIPAMMAYRSTTESATEKQNEFNKTLEQSIELYKKMKSPQAISERERVSFEANKNLKPEDRKKLGLKEEWSQTYQQFILPFSDIKEFTDSFSKITKNITKSTGTSNESVIATSKVVNQVFDPIFKNLGSDPGKKAYVLEAISEFKYVIDKIAPNQAALKKFDTGFRPEDEKEREPWLRIRKARAENRPEDIGDVLSVYLSQQRNKFGKMRDISFEDVLKTGAGTNKEFIDNIRKASYLTIRNIINDLKSGETGSLTALRKIDQAPLSDINAEMVANRAAKEQGDIEQALAAARELIDIKVGKKQNRMSNQTTISDPNIATYIEALKETLNLEKQILDARIKDATVGMDDEGTGKSLQDIEKPLWTKYKVYKQIMKESTYGSTPEAMIENYAKKVRAWISKAPEGQEEIYAEIAKKEFKKIEEAYTAVLSSGTIDMGASQQEIISKLKMKTLAETYSSEVDKYLQERKDVLKRSQMEAKDAKNVFLSVAQYSIKVADEISKKETGTGITKEWLEQYDKETARMERVLTVRKEALTKYKNIPEKELRKENALIQEQEGKIQERKGLKPSRLFFAGQYIGGDDPEISKFRKKAYYDLSEEIKGGVSNKYISDLSQKIQDIESDIFGKESKRETDIALGDKAKEKLAGEISLLTQKARILEQIQSIAIKSQFFLSQAETNKRNDELIKSDIALAKEEMRLNGEYIDTKETMTDYAIAAQRIIDLNQKINELKRQETDALKDGENKKANAINSEISKIEELRDRWILYRDNIYGLSPAIAQFSNSFIVALQNIQQETQTGISFVDSLINKLFSIAGQVFTVGINIVTTGLEDIGKKIDYDAEKKKIDKTLSSIPKDLQEFALPSILKKQRSLLDKKYAAITPPPGLTPEQTEVWKEKTNAERERDLAEINKKYTKQRSGGGAEKRDRESTAHYNALERIKKAEADLQKQQQMSSYWEGKMPDKYLLKYDAETAKYKQELQAKKDALAAEGKNLKPDEVKKFKEEINVLQEKIDLQTKYRKQAEEIAAFEKWQSDNRVGMERLRTELSIKSEIYDMEYAALYSPTRADEKSYMEWKIKSAITELEAQRLIAIEEQKRVAIKNGAVEADALSIALSTEEVQLLDIKLQKEQQMLGLVDRQLELKKQQRINEQVREVQGMISTGIFDALSMKSKNERKKQLAEIAKELSNLSEDSNTAAYGIAQAESVGNIDAINASRDKWNEVNRQIEEARKKMDEVNNSTNKWKEVLENIGDSVLKKLADKFAEMLINKTGLGDMLGMVFGGIDGINTGGKGVKGQALPAAGSALAALSLKSPKQSLQMAQEMMGLMVPGSSGSTNYNVSVAGGGGNPLGALLGGGLKFGGAGTSALGGGFAGSKLGANAGFGKAASASSASKYGTSQYLTSAMLGYAIGSSTSNRTVGVLGGAAAGFLTGGPIGALIGGIASLFGRKKGGDEAPPVQPQREFYALFRNSESLDRNTSALLKLSEGIYNQPSTFEVNKLQAERNATTINNNITINATGGNAKAIAAEVNAVISNSYQSSMGKMATSTSNWG